MDNSYDVSVIIPVYNTEKYILGTLECMLKQSCKNVEYLFIDDGSTDDSANIIKNFIFDYRVENVFKYFYKVNGGVSSARNYGLSLASGSYIMFVDSDDSINEDYVSSLLKKIVEDKSDFCFCNAKIIKNSKVICNNIYGNDCTTDSYSVSIFNNLYSSKKYHFSYEFSRTVWGKIFKKSVLDDYNILFDEKMYLFEDAYFNLLYISNVKKISFVDACLYDYYLDNGGSSRFRVNLFQEDIYKINKINSLNFVNSDVVFSKKIYFFDLLCAFVKNHINNTSNKMKFSDKIKLLNQIVSSNVYIGKFDFEIFKFMNAKKKVLYILFKLRLHSLILLILK